MATHEHRAQDAAGLALGCLIKPVLPKRLLGTLGTLGENVVGLDPPRPPHGLKLFVGKPAQQGATAVA
ncbi:hypothetical protein [Arenibaculum pallidiluteum]|uniref:hypothetical protein n=1 Tax=Arenibaculum pallidiluteum TaxID=2812559 RepID=UPI001A97A772|nr:hypothetical protein [Arenibaculum pallidiluteum]